MASGNILEDIDEKFLQCSICLCQLKEPKSLPCLHRYCRDCLAKTVKEKDTDVQCPTCREVYVLPPNGVDGFKSDFNLKNIIEFIQLHDSVKDDPMRTCIACKKKKKANAYCFKCQDFLCQSCHEFHATNDIVKDHRPHIFLLSEVGARKLTVEKLASLKEAPRCHNHAERLSELCCTTCNNLPICVACTYGVHRGHDLQEVALLAKLERERLIKKTAELMGYKEDTYSMQEELKNTRENLNRNVNQKKAEVQEEFDLKADKIKQEVRDKDGALERGKNELEEILKRKTSARKQELEEEVKKAQDKYDIFCKEERQATDAEFEKLLLAGKKDKMGLHQELEVMTKGIKDLLTSLQAQEEENTKKIKDLTDHFDDIVNRFENVNATASSILATKDEWTDVQCIGDICTAIDALTEEMKRDFPELKILSDITIGSLSSALPGRGVDITEREESLVTIEGVTGGGWSIRDITGSKDGSIVVTGQASCNQTHITVINSNGKKVNQSVMKLNHSALRYCAFLSQFKIATVCWHNELGIYDIRDRAYRKTNISDIISSWPARRLVICIAVDYVNNHIIVGGYQHRDVYVFNGDLEYIRSFTLPEFIGLPGDMTVHGGNLLVCSYSHKRAWAVTLNKGSACDIMYEFTEPDIGGGNCVPLCVCTDKHGLMYMLWRGVISGQKRSILVQYSQDGSNLLQTRVVDCKDYAESITTVDTGDGEKILIATYNTGKVIRYGFGDE